MRSSQQQVLYFVILILSWIENHDRRGKEKEIKPRNDNENVKKIYFLNYFSDI